jgi:pimeloyl-ACP methyl ester carboxylesterase
MPRFRIGFVVALALLNGPGISKDLSPELVQLGDVRTEVALDGVGSPPVIFESGFTGGLFLWQPLQSEIAKHTLTLSYERAGLGRSDPRPEPRSAEEIAHELHALLAAEAIGPPYILVGHSAGGLYVRVFAHMYPREIAGLVLIDPATEEDYERMRTQKSVEELQKMGMSSGAVGQWRALPETIDQGRRSWPLPIVPTVVLTSEKPLGAWPLESSEDMQRWLDSHNRLVAKIPGSKHIVVPNTDHLSILKADAVNEQILAIIAEVRAKKK